MPLRKRRNPRIRTILIFAIIIIVIALMIISFSPVQNITETVLA